MFIVAAVSILTSSIIGMLNETAGGIPWLNRFFDFRSVRFTVPWQVFGNYVSSATFEHFKTLRLTPLATIYLAIVGTTLLAVLMSRLLNVNVYSMHSMYRNRLMRAYLGASRWVRRPDQFTGFDPQDNLRMWELRPEMLWPTSIIDFDTFARHLPAEPFWSMVPVDAQNHLFTYLTSTKPEERRSLREVAKTQIVDAINQLMLSADLQYGIPAPTSLELLAHNRRYLDDKLKRVLKRVDREVYLPVRKKAAPSTPNIVPPPKPGAGDPEQPPVAPATGLVQEAATVSAAAESAEQRPVLGRPPLHVVNAALNLVAGENLAWQERKAASFTMSPLHSGSRALGYRDSFSYGGGNGITLGTALAISGAAVSPNSGASSSPTFTFLMTLLNARLGWWIGNPARQRFKKNSPTGSIQALLREALGRTDSEQDFVFLSDGGHFENLGLYEMVLRRCKYIIVCDATADDRYAFGDLANAVRKIRVDLGVAIEPLVTKYIGPQKDEKYGKYCAIGTICYSNVDGGSADGRLLYIKPALYSDCPPDVRNYGNESKSFPHENTMDQFFSESQFESYRALGRHIIGMITRDKAGEDPKTATSVSAFFDLADEYVAQKHDPVGDKPVQTMQDVVSWMTTSLGADAN
jgi:hypothetical protein